MIVVGLDSALTTGFAVVNADPLHGEQLWKHGAVTVRTAADVDAAADMLALNRPDVVAIEEPWIGRNRATGLVLSRLVGRWLQAIEGRGLTAICVPASMWQPGVLVGVTSKTRTPERKRAAMAFALERFGVTVGEDAADAIALAIYVARNATRKAA